jgi:GNAT superfamily N-acetyltransferase
MKTVMTKTTYLEMLSPSDFPPVATPAGVAIEPFAEPSVEFYRYLYGTVGRNHHWVDRFRMTDEVLARIVQNPQVEIYVLRVADQTAGFAELDHRVPGEIELAYFGIFPQYIGQGLGKCFLCNIVERAWSFGPGRVWLHTCDLDHPAALPNYLKAGFSIFDEEIVEQQIDPA